MIIYKTTNLVNGKFYVGKDSKNCPTYLGSGKLLKKAIKLYGKEKFKKEILQTCSSQEELNLAEQYWIQELNARNLDIGYNLTLGGEGIILGSKLSEETKRKMSKANKIEGFIERYGIEIGVQKYNDKINKQRESQLKRYSLNEEREKTSQRSSGSRNGMFNKKHTEETKNKIRAKQKGKKASPETIKLLKTIRKGKNNHKSGIFLGSRNPNAKYWKLIDPNGKEYIIHGTLNSFAKEHKLSMPQLKRFRNKPIPKPKRVVINSQDSYENKINTIGWIISEYISNT